MLLALHARYQVLKFWTAVGNKGLINPLWAAEESPPAQASAITFLVHSTTHTHTMGVHKLGNNAHVT